MANLQETLDSLQPYVSGIRFMEGMAVIDAVFKQGWSLPVSSIIMTHKQEGKENEYLLYADKKSVGLDGLITYVETTIKLNEEREKKGILYKEKVAQLREVFKVNTLDKLNALKFTFDSQPIDEYFNEDITYETTYDTPIPPPVTDDTIQISDEDREILEEEERAKQFMMRQQQLQQSTPPKQVNEYGCTCSDSEACSVCIDKK